MRTHAGSWCRIAMIQQNSQLELRTLGPRPARSPIACVCVRASCYASYFVHSNARIFHVACDTLHNCRKYVQAWGYKCWIPFTKSTAQCLSTTPQVNKEDACLTCKKSKTQLLAGCAHTLELGHASVEDRTGRAKRCKECVQYEKAGLKTTLFFWVIQLIRINIGKIKHIQTPPTSLERHFNQCMCLLFYMVKERLADWMAHLLHNPCQKYFM